MEWYYSLNGQRLGPVSQEQLDQLLRDGTAGPETLVWRRGMSAWLPHSQVTGTAGAPGSPDPSSDTEVCAVSGKRYPRREMVQFDGRWISAEHREEYFEKMREGLLPAGAFRYAGFWIRFLAKFVDGILLYALSFAVNTLVALVILGSTSFFGRAIQAYPAKQRLEFQVVSFLFGTTIAIVYACVFIRGWDATPGKMATGLKVIRADGAKLSVGRIVGRYFAEWVSSIILMIGYIMAGADEEKRALHDRICDTRVIRAK